MFPKRRHVLLNLKDENGNDLPNPPAPPAPPEPDMKAQFEALQKEFNDFKSKASNDVKAAKDKEIAALKEAGKWEEYAKAIEQQKNETEEKYSGLQGAHLHNAKMLEIRAAAVKAGIHAQSLDDLDGLDFPEVRVESTSTGRLIVHGADAAVEGLKKRRPHWFTVSATVINPGSPTVRPSATGKVTLEEIENARQAWTKSQSKADLEIYRDLILRYKKQ